MPDVRGLTQDEAAHLLAASGFAASIVTFVCGRPADKSACVAMNSALRIPRKYATRAVNVVREVPPWWVRTMAWQSGSGDR